MQVFDIVCPSRYYTYTASVSIISPDNLVWMTGTSWPLLIDLCPGMFVTLAPIGHNHPIGVVLTDQISLYQSSLQWIHLKRMSFWTLLNDIQKSIPNMGRIVLFSNSRQY